MNSPNSSVNNESVEKFLDIPYDRRWEYLKPVLIGMYMDENNTLKRISERMKDEYEFNAYPQQYRAHFRRWDIKKRTTTEEKNATISALGKRLRHDGISTSDVTINQGSSSKNVDKKQLKRYINESIRQTDPLVLHPGTFLRHNFPYAALMRSLGEQGSSSPPSTGPHTPTYLTIKSPEATTSGSSPHDGPSPTMQLVKRKILVNRSRFFLEGRDRELVAQLTLDERKSVATWLNDFWMYSFMTIKYWGRGPEIWTLSLIGSKSFPGITSSPPLNQYIDQESNPSFRFHSLPDPPTQLCRWSMHYNEPKYERIPSPPSGRIESGDVLDIHNESTWPTWRASAQPRSIVTTITQGLQGNHFSSIEAENLPLATDIIIKATEKSPDELKIEALGFAIMSRNLDVINEIIESGEDDGRLPESYSGIFPFHLAARFLDGAKTCCLVMDTLVNSLQDSNTINLRYVDNSGFTVLDTFFISILRSHSTTILEDVCGKPTGHYQYAGQDVDPCGRWDADSPCIRQLYASGSSKIPSGWKHMFCHTSVQAVCHSLSSIFSVRWRPDINTSSGLFLRRCSCCGLELKLGPLHTLILTAFFLADNAMPGENLFGMVCCLVCLLTYRADPRIAVEVSIPELLGRGSVDHCQHSAMEPAELASEIHSGRMGSWTDEANCGWRILISILRLNREGGNFNECNHIVHRREHISDMKRVHCGNSKQGQIWAAVQAELLTYRRLREYDGWLSQNFDMEKLRNALENDNEELLREFADGLDRASGESKLQRYSNCGLFYDAGNPFCAMREEVCNTYYANLDEWERTTFINLWTE